MAPDPNQKIFRNQLLRGLSDADLALLTPHLCSVELKVRYEMERPNRAIEQVFFLDSGMASVVAHGARKKQIEVGIIGREGMTGLMVVLGDDRSPHSTYIQIAGRGQRITSGALRDAMQESGSMRQRMLHFAQAFLIQTTHTAISNGSAKLEERLARWLLMAHDRVDGDRLPLVHEFLALMLGVRRPGVTVAMRSLEAQGLIDSERGIIEVVDRKGLEQVANASYGIPEAEYQRLMRH